MFIDSHCHLDFSCFDGKIETLLNQLHKNNINKLIIPATQADSWDKIEILSSRYTSIYYTLGIHPHFLGSFKLVDLVRLKQKLFNANRKCVALGEIGLDKNAQTSLELQEFVFIEQLNIAKQLGLPVILHCVKMQSRILTLLKQHRFMYGGVYHAFSGSLEVANEFIKLGFKLGIGGVITYPYSTKTRHTVAQLPIGAILLETDAPDMPVYQQTTPHNTPLNILRIFDSLAVLRAESKLQLSAQLYQNTLNIFPLCND